jgi:catechol 2,3-dioxygenase-like lactoylglutathione lyase family enzyme
MPAERAEPILPAQNFAETRAFYQALGFTAWHHSDDYDILTRGQLILHIESHADLEPSRNQTSCYWRVLDADRFHEEVAVLGLPTAGIPRLTEPRDEQWGMREFTLVDPAGNLIRIGQALK